MIGLSMLNKWSLAFPPNRISFDTSDEDIARGIYHCANVSYRTDECRQIASVMQGKMGLFHLTRKLTLKLTLKLTIKLTRKLARKYN
jgi:hypothetical protein